MPHHRVPLRRAWARGWRARWRDSSVAGFIQRTLPIALESGSDLPGLGVTVTPCERTEDQPRLVGKIIDGLLAH